MSDLKQLAEDLAEGILYGNKEAVRNLKYDKTIEAKIVKCTNNATGRYQCSYQDSTIIAYADDLIYPYSNGTWVYVVVPQNDFSKKKRIVGTIDKKGADRNLPLALEDRYIKIGNNLITGNDLVELKSYEPGGDSVVIYKKGTSTGYDFIYDADAAMIYMQEMTNAMFGAEWLTNLPEEQRLYSRGIYGIQFTVQFYKAGTQKTETYETTYTFDSSYMEGTPYEFGNWSNQIWVSDIPLNMFKEITQIRVFCGNFPVEEAGHQPDIWMRNPLWYFVSSLSAEELADTSLRVTATETGFIWRSFTESLDLTAEVRLKGRLISADDSEANYYWFVEDHSINLDSPYFTQIGGYGWRCLNEYRQTDDGIVYIPGSREFIINSDIVEEYFKTDKTRLKCVVLYGENKLSDIQTIYNDRWEYRATLSGPTTFYKGVGTDIPYSATLVKRDGTVITNYDSISWTRKSNSDVIDSWEIDGTIHRSTNGDYYTDDDNQTYYLGAAATITDYIIIYVTYTYGTVTATASIQVYNDVSGAGSWNLVIENDLQVFQYNEYGNSPLLESGVDPITVKPLTVHLYNPDGQQINDEDFLRGAVITWEYPTENTLITNPQIGTPNNQFSFSIADKYNNQYRNNDVTVHVVYEEQDIRAKTNLVFVKQGEIGTNGSEYVCRIVPKYTNIYLVATNLASDSGNNVTWYWHFNETGIIKSNNYIWPFKVVLYRDNEEVDASEYTVKWSHLDNTQGNNTHIIQFDYHTEDGIIYDYITDDEAKNSSMASYRVYLAPYIDVNTQVSNIIKAEIVYQGKTLYCTYGIPSLYNATSSPMILTWEGGYDYVVYATDGTRPAYTEDDPFKIGVSGSGSWSWSAAGDSANWKLKQGINDREYYITPPSVLESTVLTYYVKVTSGTATLVRPVEMYHNRYGMPLANSWDGSSVKVSDEEGYIITPQIMAGQKEHDNSFTGMVMGRSMQAMTDADGSESTTSRMKIGLMGYKKGTQTIFLDAQTGNAYFGKSGQGQIKMIPDGTSTIAGWHINSNTLTAADGNEQTTLYSPNAGPQKSWTIRTTRNEDGTWNKETVTARQKININDNFIVYSNGAFEAANKEFSVQPDGTLIANAGTIGGWSIGDTKLYNKDTYLFSKNGDADIAYKQATDPSTGQLLWEMYEDEDGVWQYKLDDNGEKIPRMVYDTDTIDKYLYNSSYQLGNLHKTKEYVKSGDAYALEDTYKNVRIAAGDKFFVHSDGSVDAGNGRFRIFSSGAFSADNGKFTVDPDGLVTINNGKFSIAKDGTVNANDTFIIYPDGSFSAADDDFSVSKKGEITSTAGTIGGWTIAKKSLYTTNYIPETGNGVDSDGGTYLGSSGAIFGGYDGTNSTKIDNYNLWKWGITKAGKAYFREAEVTGTIYANAGRIGNWQISNGILQAQDGSNFIKLEPGSLHSNNWGINRNGSAWFKNVDITSGDGGNSTLSWGTKQDYSWGDDMYPFSVDAAGNLTSNGTVNIYGEGSIGGCKMENGSLIVDSAHIGELLVNQLYIETDGTKNKVDVSKRKFVTDITQCELGFISEDDGSKNYEYMVPVSIGNQSMWYFKDNELPRLAENSAQGAAYEAAGYQRVWLVTGITWKRITIPNTINYKYKYRNEYLLTATPQESSSSANDGKTIIVHDN